MCAQEKLRRAQRQVAKLQGRLTEESPQVKEADLAEVRDITRAMLAELATLAAQLPGLSVAERAEQAGLKLPPPGTPPHGHGSRAGSVMGSALGSRPGSARSSGSVGGASVRSYGSVRQVQLGL